MSHMSRLDDVNSFVTKINALDLTEGERRALAALCSLGQDDDGAEGFSSKAPKDNSKAGTDKRPFRSTSKASTSENDWPSSTSSNRRCDQSRTSQRRHKRPAQTAGATPCCQTLCGDQLAANRPWAPCPAKA